MVSTKCHHENPPPRHPEKNRLPRRRQKSSPPQGKCVAVEQEFDTQEFLSEVRSLTPTERERLIRSYAR